MSDLNLRSGNLSPAHVGAAKNYLGVVMTGGVQRWVAGVGLAGGAAAAAMMIGTPIARADTIDDFLIQAEGDMTQTATLFSGLDSSSLPALAGVVSSFQSQDELISQIQAQQDTFSEALQSSSQLIGADQQLANASGDLVAASYTFVNAVNAGDLPLSATETLSDKLTGLEAGFGFLDAELFQVLPAELNAGFATIADGGTLDFAGPAPDLGSDPAASAASLTGTDPATLLSEATADLTEANTVLSGIDLTGQPSDIASLIPTSTELIGSQEMLQAGLVNFQDVIAAAEIQGSSMPGYDLVTQATTALFASSDQDLLNADAALLASDQLLAGAISGGTGLTDADTLESAVTMLGAIGADFSAFGTSFDAAFTPFLELFTAF
jgi:hypothetical protein